MADGGYGPDFLARSMFFREAEGGPTAQDLATMTAPFGGSVEQARALYQSPEVQARLQHFGLGGFNPDQIRQSPFLPNSFMQAHPGLGHLMSGMMANAAATPEAPLVSGAGSGISRAMQGMYGGPELQRQYQVRQLMAPFQAMGMQLPIMAEQRRQELLSALEQDMQKRQAMEQQQFSLRQQQGLDKMEATRPVPTPWGWMQYEGAQPAQPAGPMAPIQPHSALDKAIAPSLFTGQGGFQAPTTPATPAQPGGWQPHVLSPEQIAAAGGAANAQHPERQAGADWKQRLIDMGVPEATVKKLEADANKANATAATGGGKGWTQQRASKLEEDKGRQVKQLDSQFAPILSKYGKFDKEGNVANLDEEAWKRDDPGSYANYFQQRQQIEDWYTEAGRSLGGAYPGYEYSSRGQHTNVPKQNPFIAPGASLGSAQAGGAGSQTSQGTAIAPQGLVDPYAQPQPGQQP